MAGCGERAPRSRWALAHAERHRKDARGLPIFDQPYAHGSRFGLHGPWATRPRACCQLPGPGPSRCHRACARNWCERIHSRAPCSGCYRLRYSLQGLHHPHAHHVQDVRERSKASRRLLPRSCQDRSGPLPPERSAHQWLGFPRPRSRYATSRSVLMPLVPSRRSCLLRTLLAHMLALAMSTDRAQTHEQA